MGGEIKKYSSEYFPHDRYVKAVLSRKSAFRDFIRVFVPDVYRVIKPDSLEPMTTSFLDKNMKVSFSDLGYLVKIATEVNGREHLLDMYLALLVEHKSVPYPDLYYQLLGYIYNFWLLWSKQGKSPIPVVVIVFYHGKQKWRPKSIREQFAKYLDDKFLRYLPDFEIEFIDLNEIPEQKLISLVEDVFLLIMLHLLRHIQQGPWEAFMSLLDLFKFSYELYFSQSAYEAFLLGLNYLSQFRNFDLESAKQVIMEKLNLELELQEDSPFGMLAKWIEERVEKAKQEAWNSAWNKAQLQIAYNMYKEGLSLEQIVRITGLSKQEVLAYIEQQAKKD